MKFFTDLLPVLLFFIAFYATKDLFLATGLAIAATVFQVAWAWLTKKKIELSQWITLAAMIILGGATLLFRDPAFVMWKPTAVNWALALILLLAHWAWKKAPLKRFLGTQFELPDAVWTKLTAAWVLFFLVVGALNLFVAWNFSEEIWVNFKLFGMLGLTLLFVVAQSVYLSRHLPDEMKK